MGGRELANQGGLKKNLEWLEEKRKDLVASHEWLDWQSEGWTVSHDMTGGTDRPTDQVVVGQETICAIAVDKFMQIRMINSILSEKAKWWEQRTENRETSELNWHSLIYSL